MAQDDKNVSFICLMYFNLSRLSNRVCLVPKISFSAKMSKIKMSDFNGCLLS